MLSELDIYCYNSIIKENVSDIIAQDGKQWRKDDLSKYGQSVKIIWSGSKNESCTLIFKFFVRMPTAEAS